MRQTGAGKTGEPKTKKDETQVSPFAKFGAEQVAAARAQTVRLDRYDVLGLRAFFTLSNSELYSLAFCQSFETVALDGTEVCKNIGTGFLRDKAKAFALVKPFDSTGCGVSHNLLNLSR